MTLSELPTDVNLSLPSRRHHSLCTDFGMHLRHRRLDEGAPPSAEPVQDQASRLLARDHHHLDSSSLVPTKSAISLVVVIDSHSRLLQIHSVQYPEDERVPDCSGHLTAGLLQHSSGWPTSML